MINRRALLALGALAWAGPAAALPARALVFPRDHGSHPDLRTEWWYLTGQARTGPAPGRLWGFQITFFRSRVEATQGLQSAFAARQLIFAHAALTDLQGARQLHDQRIARAGFGIAQAAEDDTNIHLRDWSLLRQATTAPGASRYQIRAQADGFALELDCASTQPVLLQGDAGLSRKGPRCQPGQLLLQPAAAGGDRRHHAGRAPHGRNRRACARQPRLA